MHVHVRCVEHVEVSLLKCSLEFRKINLQYVPHGAFQLIRKMIDASFTLQAVCFNGKCGLSLDTQCRDLWGPGIGVFVVGFCEGQNPLGFSLR